MFYAIDDMQTNSARVVWGFPTKAERDRALTANHPGDWRPVTATEAEELAINSNRINFMGVFERPNWTKNAYFRHWHFRRFTNGISLGRPETTPVFLH